MRNDTMPFVDIYMDAEGCGYSGLSFNETMVYIQDKYKITNDFNEEDWQTIEDAWISGNQSFENK